MTMNGMADFERQCTEALVAWYNENGGTHITAADVYVVWSCRTLQNYKALLSTAVQGDGIYAEYTYNGDRQELYEDVYQKLTNRCLR